MGNKPWTGKEVFRSSQYNCFSLAEVSYESSPTVYELLTGSVGVSALESVLTALEVVTGPNESS